MWFLGEIEKAGIPSILTAGNHDHVGENVTQLDGFRYFPWKHLKIVTWEPEVHIMGETGFICLSWHGYSTEEIKKEVEARLPSISKCKYKVVLLHECVKGVKLDNGFIIPNGIDIPNIPEVTYWAVGDIHNEQPTNVANGRYAGAPIQFTFSDKPEKGVIVVDLDHPTAKPEFIPIISKPLKVVKSVSEIDEDAYYKVQGDFSEVLKANTHDKVVKTRWVKSKAKPLDYQRVGIVEGLPEMLAEKGIPKKRQAEAVEWVEDLLKKA